MCEIFEYAIRINGCCETIRKCLSDGEFGLIDLRNQDFIMAIYYILNETYCKSHEWQMLIDLLTKKIMTEVIDCFDFENSTVAYIMTNILFALKEEDRKALCEEIVKQILKEGDSKIVSFFGDTVKPDIVDMMSIIVPCCSEDTKKKIESKGVNLSAGDGGRISRKSRSFVDMIMERRRDVPRLRSHSF